MQTPELVDYEVTDGGVIVRLTKDQDIDLTTPVDTVAAHAENATAAFAKLTALQATIPLMLNELAGLLAELGDPCPVCEGRKGREINRGPVDGWEDCGACEGSGIRAGAAA